MLITCLKHLLCNESCRKHQLPWWHKRLWSKITVSFWTCKTNLKSRSASSSTSFSQSQTNVGWSEGRWITELWVELSQQGSCVLSRIWAETLFTTNISVYNSNCLPCWTNVFQKLQAFKRIYCKYNINEAPKMYFSCSYSFTTTKKNCV